MAKWINFRNTILPQSVHNEPHVTCLELDRITEKWIADLVDPSSKCVPGTI